ncbi:hypothetical protein JKA74_00675 [Marivirga sp. S37H4]|uniref:Restriction endonuclease n=1 Tax=Marivirga aurantiaca TaxID=2802615 RepID=A0A935C4X2_9BACT|nr:hypothetical protein [Marivirga aurantiaca]MBK6263531.1 hypothetical protein [Marivirga aurantiaca]
MKKLNLPDLNLEIIRQEMERTIRKHMKNLDSYNQSDHQKQLEICQLGKILVTYFPKYSIEEVRERPDFIISDGIKRIGIEHQTVLDVKTKKKQGFYENIFNIAERDLQGDSLLPNFLANCYLKNNLSFKSSDKTALIQLVKEIVTEFILSDNFLENPLIRRIRKMPHSQKSLSVNFGGYWVKSLDSETLRDFIVKKEGKVESYRKNTGLEQWLLLVTGGTAEYSFDIKKPVGNLDFKSSFDKIFLMADFDNELYELK